MCCKDVGDAVVTFSQLRLKDGGSAVHLRQPIQCRRERAIGGFPRLACHLGIAFQIALDALDPNREERSDAANNQHPKGNQGFVDVIQCRPP